MISGIGGGMGGMPSMDAMRQMQQKMFNKADADASGGLDVKEFESAMANSPMAAQSAQGTQAPSAADAFKKMDGDGDGQLTATEMQEAQKQMMQRIQSTVQAFGGGGMGGGMSAAAGLTGASGTEAQSSLDALLKALKTDDEASTTTDATDTASTDTDKQLVAQLRAMVDRLTASYGNYDTQSLNANNRLWESA